MHFRIADTFTNSLAKLTGQEQRAVKSAAFDLQLDPAGPAYGFTSWGGRKTQIFGLSG